MERILTKMNFEIESCEMRLCEEKQELEIIKLKERMKTIKEFKHLVEAELDWIKGMEDTK